jgi:glyceraldehyde-3-phosphate dehydrogenase/erythrose-4-phosphate dehydrogenase|tara:strand:+ start:6188 stop:6322 length:135 start_codon:yes stop_codon:yes gene_type:complete
VNTTTDAAVRVAINGFGRIGTSDARAIGKLDPDPPQRDIWTVLQ